MMNRSNKTVPTRNGDRDGLTPPLALDQAAMAALGVDAKIGLLATRDPEGLPHVTLITSLNAKDPTRLMFGQFCEGLGKSHLQSDPRAAFMIVNSRGRCWSGTAHWAEKASGGADLDAYNSKPMFRYNAYFGVHTVHYLDLVHYAGNHALPRLRLALGAGALAAARTLRVSDAGSVPALSNWAQRLLRSPRTLKFASWIADNGYPRLSLPLPCTAANSGRLLMSGTPAGASSGPPRPGQQLSVFAINLDMESVLVRGTWRHRGRLLSDLELDYVYNSMPPKQGQVYPRQPLRAISSFIRGA